MAGMKMLLVAMIALLSAKAAEAAVCSDNMIYMDLCTQWESMCANSKFLQEKCPLTCKKCKPVACVWDEFTEYTKCSQSCGGGFKTRSRVIKSPPLHGGAPCNGSAFESTVCNAQPCPEDCEWGPYGDWSDCDKPCGTGNEYRDREVKSPAKYGGANCTGEPRENKKCNLHNCVIHCEFKPWEKFTDCSASCGGGTQFRTRGIKVHAAHGGDECQGDAKEEQDCNTHKCPVPCEWDAWGEWDKCSLTCGGGMTARTRNIKTYALYGGKQCEGQAAEMKGCNEDKCPRDCKWGPYNITMPCSTTCGDGVKWRKRTKVQEADPGGRNCTGTDSIDFKCNLRPCGIDCEWDEFGEWDTCSKTCGEGQDAGFQTRKRIVKIKEAFGGRPCPDGDTQRRACNEKACPVPIDCKWGAYGNWTTCTKTCGNGNQVRTRVVETLASNGGKQCDGTNTDFRPCNEFPCPEPCQWNDYGAWSDCDKDCGGGSQSRSRTVFKEAKYGGKPCPGEPTQSRKCNENPCAVNCLWNEFGEWSDCTETCGGGTRTKVRTIKQKAAYGGMTCSGYATASENCNEAPCAIDCQLSPFSEWTPCSQSCTPFGTKSFGKQVRSQVVAQAARNNGKACPPKATLTQTRDCNKQACPIACEWSPFTKWTPCSQNCGGGYQMRTRKVVVKAEHGGKACHGCATDSRACNSQQCARNCKWGQWLPWTKCTEKCGGGTQNRTRSILIQAANGGQECTGESTSFRDCNTQKCPIDCQWTKWGDWDTCTKTCGGGMQGRTRSVFIKERYGGKPCVGDPQQMQGCSMQACPICKDSPRYARFCPTWVAYCANSEFVKGCCRKSCRLC